MKFIKTLKIDINKKNYETIPSVEFDKNARFLHVYLLNNSVPFDLTGCSVKIAGMKADNTEIFNNCKIIDYKKGFVEIELTEQMNAAAGSMECELKIYSADGVLTTKTFNIYVSKSVTRAANITSSNEFKALTDALNKVQGIDNKADKVEVEEKFEEFGSQLEKKATKTELQVLESRMDNFTSLEQGSTSGDAELIDGRIGNLGEKYENIGNAIRNQISFLIKSGLYSYKNVTVSNAIAGYVANNGNLCTDSAFHTAEIELNEGETILLYGNGYLGNVSLIAKVLSTGYEPLVVSTNSDYDWFDYTANEKMKVVLSFMDKTKARAVILKKNKTIFDSKVDNKSIGLEKNITTYTNDAYIHKDGRLISGDNSYHVMSEEISLKRGDVIFVECEAVKDVVSIITKVSNGKYTPLVIANGGTSYMYEATENMDVVISARNNWDKLYCKYNKFNHSQLKNYADKINLLNSIIELKTNISSVIDDCYITSDGTKSMNTNSYHVMSEEISLKRGDVIYVECEAVKDVVSIISKVKNNIYTPLVIANDENCYRYEALEDINIVISTRNNWDKTYTIYNKFNYKHIDDILLKLKAFDIKTSNANVTDDCYITSDGTKSMNTNSYHVMSEEISLNKGETIFVECEAVKDVVSVISQVSNGKYTPLVIANGGTSYMYTASREMNVVISARKNWTGNYLLYNISYPEIDNSELDITPSFSMFEKFGIIGDSYASGEVAINGYLDYYNVSWGQILARMCGNKCTNFSSGGLSTRTWLTHPKGLSLLNSTEVQQLYIGALGINDYYHLGESYLGTISDIETKRDTFYGNYATIIESVKTKAPNSKIILLTTTGTTDVAKKFNTAIVNIANHYNIPCIVQNDDKFFNSDFYLKNMVNGHPLAIVYSAMAKAFRRMIEKCMFDNLKYFRDYTGE